MNRNDSVFLTQAENDKYGLLLDIASLKRDELPVKKRIALSRKNEPLVDDVNLKQVAALLNRTYGSLYNTYMSIVADLKEVIGEDTEDIQRLFSVPLDAYHYHLVNQSDVFDFVNILLKGEEVKFEEFWTSHDISKATALRHLKGVRDLIRSFDIRMYYDPIRLEGDENKIRLVLIILFWLATDGHTWPFETIDRLDALKAFDLAIERFQLAKPNVLTRELGAYLVVTMYYRIAQRHYIQGPTEENLLRYPVPNMIKTYINQPFIRPALIIKNAMAQMTMEEAMAESFNLYDLMNFGPILLQGNNQYMPSYEDRYERYIPKTHKFVMDFMAKVPINLEEHLNLDEEDYQGLVQTLMATVMTIYMFKQDVMSIMANHLMDDYTRLRDNPVLKQDIEDTVDYLLLDKQLDFISDLRDQIVSGLYNVLRQVVQRVAPTNPVKVVLVSEQSFLGYFDLMMALKNIRYVTVTHDDADLADADLVITTSSISLANKVNPNAVMFKWNQNADSDHYGRLYGLLRELWLQKSAD
ncbi:helix-turn-helix domain-containing protein [Latilactobacillus sakei]|uniref:helix-turn-helix domain-containing protein n=1 Tax=Latilactobacillus sakei TaxID=1599 RepID=UPI000C131860|nr:helix-turn-helix domain-containing protein [Latilactobacillus sakei]SOB44508.1 Mga helix-turn-helix domain protein [Latilactobacillus sakei]